MKASTGLAVVAVGSHQKVLSLAPTKSFVVTRAVEAVAYWKCTASKVIAYVKAYKAGRSELAMARKNQDLDTVLRLERIVRNIRAGVLTAMKEEVRARSWVKFCKAQVNKMEV